MMKAWTKQNRSSKFVLFFNSEGPSSSRLSKVGKNYNNFPAYKIWMSQIEWEQDKIEMVIKIFYFFKDCFRTDLEDENEGRIIYWQGRNQTKSLV